MATDVALQPCGVGVGEEHASPRAGEVRLEQDGRRRLVGAHVGDRRQHGVEVTDDRGRLDGTLFRRSTAIRADGGGPHDQRAEAVVGRDPPDLGGGRPVVRRPLGREDDARCDRESGGTGGGEVGGLATHPRHVERRWVIQRDDGCGGAHAAHGAARTMWRACGGHEVAEQGVLSVSWPTRVVASVLDDPFGSPDDGGPGPVAVVLLAAGCRRGCGRRHYTLKRHVQDRIENGP